MRTSAIIATGMFLVCAGWAGPTAGKPWTAPTAGVEFAWVVSANLWTSKFEITNLEFRHFRPAHDSGMVREYDLSRERQPVVKVSYEDAIDFAAWLTESDRVQGHISDEQYYRLPSSEEWLAIAGCNDGRTYPWGEDWPPKAANVADASTAIDHPLNLNSYRDGHAVTSSVDGSEGNEHGVHGMGGNVAEWVAEWYNPKRRRRTVRGGSWRMNKQTYMDCNFRNGFKPDFRTDSIGIRLVLGGPPALDIDPRWVLGAIGGILLGIGGYYGFRLLRIQRGKPKIEPAESNAVAEAPRSVEPAAFASASRHSPTGKGSARDIPPPSERTRAPTASPDEDRPVGSTARLARSMDETQERDKSIVASILAIRNQAQVSRDAGQGDNKPPKLPDKRK